MTNAASPMGMTKKRNDKTQRGERVAVLVVEVRTPMPLSLLRAWTASEELGKRVMTGTQSSFAGLALAGL